MSDFTRREIPGWIAAVVGFDPEAGEVVLTPDAPGAGHWVGAPSLFLDDESGIFFLAYRRRRPRDGSTDERGYLAAVAASPDGLVFDDIWQVRKEEVGTSSIERLCIRRLRNGGWVLYTSWQDPPEGTRWRIDVVRAAAPDRFDIDSAAPVLLPADVGVDAVKDPYVVLRGSEYLMFVSTFLAPEGPAPTGLAVSNDGINFRWRGKLFGVGEGWDRYQARLGSVASLGDLFLGFYDGAGSPAEDTEERCGLAVSRDLTTWRRISTDGPALVSSHASGSLRYVDAIRVGDEFWIYYEYARPDGSHDLRRARVARPSAEL